MSGGERRAIRQSNCRHGIEKAEELDGDRQAGEAIFHPAIGTAGPSQLLQPVGEGSCLRRPTGESIDIQTHGQDMRFLP